MNISRIRMQSSCIDCTERKVGCHARCLRYIDAKKANQELKHTVRVAQYGGWAVHQYKLGSIKRQCKATGKKYCTSYRP